MASAIIPINPLILMHRMSTPSLEADELPVLTVLSTATLYQTEASATTNARRRA